MTPLLSLGFSSRPRSSVARAACCVACLLGSSLAFALQAQAPKELRTPAPVIALKPAALDKLEDSACFACHADVAREWATTAHAIAWIDEPYVAALLEKKKPETCWGCHAPKPLLQGDLSTKPAARDEPRRLGITCESCHLGSAGQIQGPRGTPTTAHPSQASAVFVAGHADALCINCHRTNIGPVVGIAKDFEVAKMSERGLSCMGCHAADVEMRFAGTNGQEEPPVRKGKSHALQTPRDPAFLRQAFELTAVSAAGKCTVTIANKAGHRVPGLIGRTLEFEAVAFGDAGQQLATKTLSIDASAYLPVDGRLDLVLDVSAIELHVTGRHLDPRAAEPVVFLDVRLPAKTR